MKHSILIWETRLNHSIKRATSTGNPALTMYCINVPLLSCCSTIHLPVRRSHLNTKSRRTCLCSYCR